MNDPTLTAEQTAEHERALLGAAMQDADTARELLPLVQAPMIEDPRWSRAWSALRRVLADDTDPGSLQDVWSEAERIGARLVVIDPALCAYVGDPHGEIVGFAGGPWQTPAERKADAELATANGAGVPPIP